MLLLESSQVGGTLDSMTISESIKRAIEDSGMSRYQIARRTGIEEATLSRFVNGVTSMTTDTLDKLAPALGLRLVVKRPKKRKRG